MVEKIKNILEEVRVMLQVDSGDLEFVDYTEDKVVLIRLLGHCAGCIHAQETVKGLIQAKLQDALGDEVKAVEAI